MLLIMPAATPPTPPASPASDYVPVLTSLSSVYSPQTLPSEEARWTHLRTAFAAAYPGEAITFVARSPGRVNLIGEHIDYSLFDVLPMAISQDVLIAVHVGAKDGMLKLQNTADAYEPREFEVAGLRGYKIDSKVLEWSNYFLSGVKGAYALNDNLEVPSMHCLIDGRIPTGSGLSSSSAFVCAALLAVRTAVAATKLLPTPVTVKALAGTTSKSELVKSAIISERNVGVNSGGMDQSASVFGVPDHALRVQFSPELNVTPIAFHGNEFAFVIANTLVVADKHVTGPVHYNLRVVETTLAAEILAKQCGLGALPVRDGFGGTLRGVVDAFEKSRGISFDGVIEVAKRVFVKKGGYTLAEASTMLGVPEEEITQKYMTRFPVRFERLQLRARTLHVLEEARRVTRFCDLLAMTPTPAEIDTYYASLGAIMLSSHASCRVQYDCSCPELDAVVALAIANGAYGSRLTGAGWGGATISLVRKKRVEGLVDALKKEYYYKHFPGISEEQLAEAICVTEPGLGSAVVVTW
ncbi:ribosomal protein S5 domain 2-type protein [Limtongia smithiae]|uniref:ribosomal protein S5 domain 2-type protein n=1 Tax=Limtongia smithiae TaxID=1125753 RepID=UPI0034CF1062